MADDTGTVSPAGSSPASTPASSAPAVSTPAPATSAPATASPAAASTPDPSVSSGEPPKERWDSILNNARAKARADAESEFKQRYGKYDVFERDPWKGVQDWLEQAKDHSLYGPSVTEYAARLLQSRRGAQTPAQEPQPDVPIVDANGNVTGQTYSATRLREWQQWDWQQKQSQLDQRLQPIEAMRAQHEEAQQTAELQRQSFEQAGQTLASLRQNPLFVQHEARVKQVLMDHPEFGANVHAAYAHFLETEHLPGVTQTEQARVLDSLKTQAQGGTVSPASAGGNATPKFKNFREAAEYYAAHPDEAAAMANR